MKTEQKETFEQKLKKIEEISQELQNPNTELEKAVELFDDGMKLAKDLDKQLANIERHIEIVLNSWDDDTIQTAPYQPN